MMQQQLRKKIGVSVAACGLVAAGYGLARVHAEGGPTQQPLWYAGTVADDKGAPLEGNHKVSLRLFQTPTGGAADCVVGPADVAFQKGRFRVDASACLDDVKARGDWFAELSVDDESKPFPRAKVGAVPFAVEAQHAVSATTALTATSAGSATSAASANAAAGALDTRIKALEPKSLFRAGFGEASISIPSWAAAAVVKFTTPQFDLGSEYNKDTGVFTPAASGYYQVNCELVFSHPDYGYQAYLGALLFVGEKQAATNAFMSEARTAGRNVSTLLRLNAGDKVTCRVYQETIGGTASTLNAGAFSASRVALAP